MPASAAYNGLTPVKTLTGDPIGTIREYRVPADTAAIGAGDLVTLTSGAATKIAVTPTPATASSLPIGVVVGVRYTTPAAAGAQELHGQYLPGSATTAGYTNIWVKVIDNPDVIYKVQADGALTSATIGLNAPLGSFTVNSATGRSTVNLTAASAAGTSSLAVRIVDVVDPTSSYPTAHVIINPAVHLHRLPTGK